MKKSITVIWLMCMGFAALAQETKPTEEVHERIEKKEHHPMRGVYTATGADGALLSFGSMKENGEKVRNIPRFSLFFNIGTTVNYDFNNTIGLFSGFNLKNIGLIANYDTVKIKRRVYTIGIPLGFKIGDLNDRVFFFFGGQYDLAFNYKEKHFIDGKKVNKFNEWFSDRTPLLMPSLFGGVKMDAFSVKLQYYPRNFFNTDFKETKDGVVSMPFQNADANLFFVSLGYTFKYKG